MNDGDDANPKKAKPMAEQLLKNQSSKHASPWVSLDHPEVEVIKLNSAKIYRFLQLLSHSRGFFARV